MCFFSLLFFFGGGGASPSRRGAGRSNGPTPQPGIRLSFVGTHFPISQVAAALEAAWGRVCASWGVGGGRGGGGGGGGACFFGS